MVLTEFASQEMFERWCRSVGVDLFDLLLASIRHPWYSLLSKYGATLLYCSLHEQALVLHTFCTAKYRDARRISGSLPESNCASWGNGALQNEVSFMPPSIWFELSF